MAGRKIGMLWFVCCAMLLSIVLTEGFVSIEEVETYTDADFAAHGCVGIRNQGNETTNCTINIFIDECLNQTIEEEVTAITFKGRPFLDFKPIKWIDFNINMSNGTHRIDVLLLSENHTENMSCFYVAYEDAIIEPYAII